MVESVDYDLLLSMAAQLTEDIKSCDEWLISGKVPDAIPALDDFSPASLLSRLKELG